jgi:RNA polymerase sigma-70 factor (ECF subfamily)
MTETAKYTPDELIRNAQKGDPMAFKNLVYLYDNRVLRTAFKMLGNRQDAEDVYQEVFLRVYSSLHRFRFQSTFETWLYRIVVNTTINYRKTRNRYLNATWIPDSQDDCWSPEDKMPLADEIIINKETGAQIQKMLEKLTLYQRTVFVLRYYQDFKIREIADIVECSEGTIKNTLFRITQKMRHSLSILRQ